MVLFHFREEKKNRFPGQNEENSRKISQLSVFSGSRWVFNPKISRDFKPNSDLTAGIFLDYHSRYELLWSFSCRWMNGNDEAVVRGTINPQLASLFLELGSGDIFNPSHLIDFMPTSMLEPVFVLKGAAWFRPQRREKIFLIPL